MINLPGFEFKDSPTPPIDDRVDVLAGFGGQLPKVIGSNDYPLALKISGFPLISIQFPGHGIAIDIQIGVALINLHLEDNRVVDSIISSPLNKSLCIRRFSCGVKDIGLKGAPGNAIIDLFKQSDILYLVIGEAFNPKGGFILDLDGNRIIAIDAEACWIVSLARKEYVSEGRIKNRECILIPTSIRRFIPFANPRRRLL